MPLRRGHQHLVCGHFVHQRRQHLPHRSGREHLRGPDQAVDRLPDRHHRRRREHWPKHPGCPCFGDQPLLGIDKFNVYISTNEFSILGPEFNGAQIYAIAKSDLTNPEFQPPNTPAHFVHFDKLTNGDGSVAASVQPALTTGVPKAEFFMNSLDPNATFDQRIGVWAMTNRQAVATGGKPTLSSIVIPSEAYAIPPGADQKGTGSTLDSGDDRMQQVQYINGELWGALDTSVTIPKDSAGSRRRSMVRCAPKPFQRRHLGSAVFADKAMCRSRATTSCTRPSRPRLPETSGW